MAVKLNGVKEITNLFESEENLVDTLINRAEEIDVIKEGKLVREIVASLKRTLKKNKLTALSAPAIGYNKRIFVIDFSDEEVKTFVNPVISNSEGLELVREVCSSLPGKQYIRPRNKTIDVIYQTPTQEIKTKRLTGLASFVFQHEVDHLDGVTLDDIGLDVDDDFDNATDDERAEVIDLYVDSLDLKQKMLSQEIEDDETLRKINDGYRLVEALARGDVKLEDKEK